MRQLRTGLVAGFKNRSGGRHRMQERCASGVGGCSDHDGHMAQTRGQDRIRVAIAAREPVWLAEQKVDADYSRLCCDFREPGELVAPPGPLSNVADRVALDLDDQGSVRRPRSRQVAFVSVKYPVAQIGQQTARRRIGDQQDGQAEQHRNDPGSRPALPQRLDPVGGGGRMRAKAGVSGGAWVPQLIVTREIASTPAARGFLRAQARLTRAEFVEQGLSLAPGPFSNFLRSA